MTTIANTELQTPHMPSRQLPKLARIVVKVGSAVIAGDGNVRPEIFAALANDVADVRAQGIDVVLVVSGAVALGYRGCGFATVPSDVVQRQAAASVGQPKLMAALDHHLGQHGIATAQLLMSADDIENRRRFLSARHTLQALLAAGVVPVINENDALSDDETKVGDNDHLAALTTSVASADLLVLLSRVAGLYRNGDGEIIREISIDAPLANHINDSLSDTGVGGMKAKVSAAQIAARWGVPTIIADGTTSGTLQRLLNNEPVGTYFAPNTRKLDARKQWIAVRSRSRGSVWVDVGAQTAVAQRGASLLAKGITQVHGDFTIGARIEVCDAEGQPFALGLASYSADEMRRVAGHKAHEIQDILGYVYVDEMVHRDDMVLLLQAAT